MSWYSFGDSGDDIGIPVLNDASHAFTQKLGLPDPWQQLYGDPAKKQKAALQMASDKLKELADRERATQMEGMNRALAFYEPAQKTYNTLYGGTLTKAPQNIK